MTDLTHNDNALILLVSPTKSELQRLEQTLSQLDERILTARDLPGCLAHTKEQLPDVVVLDFELGDDAYLLCERLRELPGGDLIGLLGIVPNESELLTGALTAGIDDYVPRPIHPLGLLRRTDNLLRLRRARIALRDVDETRETADKKYRNLFDSSNDAIFIVDMLTARVVDANRAAVNWLGYSYDELTSLSHHDIEVWGDDGSPIDELTTQGHFIYEQNYLTKNGKTIPAEVSSRIIRHEGRRAVINTARDIGPRKRIEENENEQRRLAEALRDTAAAVNTSLKLDDVIKQILGQVAKVVPCQAANIMLLEDDNTAKVMGYFGYEHFDMVPADVERTWIIDKMPNFRWIVENRRPLTISDTHKHSGWYKSDILDWIRSFVGAPIIAENKVIGFLNLDHSEPNAFNDDHGENLLAFCNQVSIAIQNARLHEAVQAHAEQLETHVAQRTVELIQMNINLKEEIVERQRIEQELAAEHNVLRTLIDNLPDGVYISDTNGKIMLANHSLAHSFSQTVPSDDLVGQSVYDLLPENVRTIYHDQDQQIIISGKSVMNHEIALHSPDGVERHMLSSRIPLRDSQGHITSIIGINHDVTALHQADAALKEERNLLRVLIDNVPDDIYVKDTYGRFTLVNRAVEQSLRMTSGQSDKEVLGATDYDFLPKDFADARRAEEQNLIQTGEPIINLVLQTVTPNGEHKFALTNKIPLRDADGNITAIVGVNRDITALRRADEALKEERNLLRILIENIPDEVYVKDTEGRIILANKALKRRAASRLQNEEVIGATDFDYVLNEQEQHIARKWQQQEQRLLRQELPILNEEIMITNPLGEPVWLLTTKVPFKDSQGAVLGLVGINRNITEIKGAQERLQHIVTSAHCILWYAILEVDEENISWDMQVPDEQAARTFLPVKAEPGQTYVQAWATSILPGDEDQCANTLRTAVDAQQSSCSYEFRCYRDDGEIRWLHNDVQIKPLTPGRYSLVGVSTDVTESKQAEETLKRSKELLEQRVQERTSELSRANQELQTEIAERKRAEESEREQRRLAEALTDTAAILSRTLDLGEVLDRILTYVARVVPRHEVAGVMLIEDDIYVRTIRMREYAGPDVISSSHKERVYLDSLPHLRRMLDTGQPLTISDTDNNPDWAGLEGEQETRSYIGMPIYAEGHVIGFINLGSIHPGQFLPKHSRRLLAFSNQAGVAIQNARLFEAVRQHATDLRRRVAERTAELEYERAQLHAILNAMTEGVIYYDNDGHAEYINQSLARMTGYSAEEWIGSHQDWAYANLIVDDAREMMETSREIVHKKGVWRGEVRMLTRSGDMFDAKWVTTLVTNADGEPAGVVSVLRDISAEKRLEAQKARFIATASHELRTPITNLKTRLYLIEKQPDKLAKHLDVMVSVTDRLRKLVDDLLDISRFEHGIIALELNEIVVQELVTSVVTVQQPEAELSEITLTHKMLSNPLHIQADYARLTQVITNLVTNAINYTPAGGQVEVRVNTETHDYNGYEQQMAVIHVCDTGIGIPDEMLPDVFKPFFRVNDYNNGMGLGLSISKDIIELHGGDLIVESKVNQGTCFSVRLPLLVNGEIPEFGADQQEYES